MRISKGTNGIICRITQMSVGPNLFWTNKVEIRYIDLGVPIHRRKALINEL